METDVQKQGSAQGDKQGRGWLRRVMNGIPVRGDVQRVKEDSRRRCGGWGVRALINREAAARVGGSEGQCSPSVSVLFIPPSTPFQALMNS